MIHRTDCGCNDFASNSKANTGVTLGAIGTGLGTLAALGGGNGLGGLFGRNDEIARLMAENAALRQAQATDAKIADTYKQTLADRKDLRDELGTVIARLADEAANNRVEVAEIKATQKCEAEKAVLREQILTGKINEVAIATNGRFAALDQTIACISGKVDGITKTVVPNSAVCPGWGAICINTQTCPASTTTSGNGNGNS